MRRLSLVLLAFTLAGCDALKDAFSARAEVVARANDQTLSVESLADLAGSGKQVPLDPIALGRLANVWVDYALFAQALAAGRDLRDSATMAAAMWPLVSQVKWERFHERLVATRADLSGAQVDSAYRAGGARLFQHILFQVPPSAAPTMDAQKRRQAEQVLPQAKAAGARFGQLAQRYSEDPQSKVRGGALGVTERGQFVRAFEDAAWQLPPGGVSSLVKSPFGYHIIRRPPLAEVRDSFRVGLEERLSFRLDSVYLDSLSVKRHIEPAGRAPALVRAAAQDLDDARTSGRVVVTYSGGSFRMKDLVRWLGALDPQVAQALGTATDDQIKQFLKVVVQRQLLLEAADSAGVTLTPQDWTQLRAQHDSALAILGSVLNLTPRILQDSAATPEARASLARARVQDYFDRVVHGRARFYPIPPFLGETLRARGSWSVDQAGVRRALERAKEIRATADSLTGQGAPRMTPAPGPAPVDTTPRRSPPPSRPR
jgi:peptidyl-prolyl cis-trans isomerase D